SFELHPALIDGALQVLLAFGKDEPESGTRVPYAVDRISWNGSSLPESCWVVARPRPSTTDAYGQAQVFDLVMTGEAGQVLIRIDGLLVRPVRETASEQAVLGESAELLTLAPRWESAHVPVPTADRPPKRLLVFDRAE